MKREYKKLGINLFYIDFESAILAGSETDAAMKMNTVEVAPYTDGFESEGGFQEISFD